MTAYLAATTHKKAVRLAALGALEVVLIVNAYFVYLMITHLDVLDDWLGWQDVARTYLAGGDIYASGFFRWSPFAAPLVVAATSLGLVAWRLAHFGALVLLRDLRLMALVLCSYPFWGDVKAGSLLTFVFVAAVLAIRGSRLAAVAYFGFCLLMPRPLMASVAVWLLWHHRTWRLPVALAGLAELAALAATGQLAWLGVLVGSTSQMQISQLGPSALIGGWWIVVGLPISAWALRRRHLGIASLAASPYWLGYYLLFAFLEFVPAPLQPLPRERAGK